MLRSTSLRKLYTKKGVNKLPEQQEEVDLKVNAQFFNTLKLLTHANRRN